MYYENLPPWKKVRVTLARHFAQLFGVPIHTRPQYYTGVLEMMNQLLTRFLTLFLLRMLIRGLQSSSQMWILLYASRRASLRAMQYSVPAGWLAFAGWECLPTGLRCKVSVPLVHLLSPTSSVPELRLAQGQNWTPIDRRDQ